ncbi:hypothetical protein BDB00DRAFT_333283 [Zychaea mexicana]|uniref:uncharacterized protein n=1 Tax=Zychaea mexicana TaxID=64656 RepID=UPI0022FF0AA5|nr:uncharacterized protein BDB00DRAFT_333283 [Zychaea mexicana]KAI9499081.1 hypothetical protein BDB00DRAFT_333283 [Zychaea mexicana]
MDPMNWRAPHIKNRFVHTKHQALRKCCGCIHLRVGATLSCLVWVGLSLYFAILSFQESSPFFSHMDAAPLYVFAVASLLLTIVGFVGLFVLFRNRWEYLRLFSRLVWTALFIFLVDGLANACYFTVQRGDFMTWCIGSSARHISSAASSANATSSFVFDDDDYYNCQRLYEDEVKFGLISIFLMIVLYVYWGLCIYSFSHKQGISNMELARMEMGMHPRTVMAAGPGMAAPPPPPPVGRAAGPGRSNIIVLNNEPPSSNVNKNNNNDNKNSSTGENDSNSNNKKKTSYFSFRSLRPHRNSIRDHEAVRTGRLDDYQRRTKRKSVPNLFNREVDPHDAHKNRRRRSSSE